MDQDKTTLERAFELAQSGRCKSVQEIRQALKQEHYSLNQLEGASVKKQLSALIKKASSS